MERPGEPSARSEERTDKRERGSCPLFCPAARPPAFFPTLFPTLPSPPIPFSSQHPNIVRLYEVIDDPDGSHIYMVMEYVEGGTVQPHSSTVKSMPELIVLRYFRDLCKGRLGRPTPPSYFFRPPVSASLRRGAGLRPFVPVPWPAPPGV